MDAIKVAANISIGRACGFAGLAVICLMLGLSFEPVLATKSGGLFCLIATIVLAFLAYRAPYRAYKHTELWLILSEEDRPPKEFAQQVIGQVLRETYIWFARRAAVLAIGLLSSSVTLRFFTSTLA